MKFSNNLSNSFWNGKIASCIVLAYFILELISLFCKEISICAFFISVISDSIAISFLSLLFSKIGVNVV